MNLIRARAPLALAGTGVSGETAHMLPRRSHSHLVLTGSASLLTLAAVVMSGCGGDNKNESPAPALTEAGAPAPTIANLVSVNQIAIYQGVKVTLVDNGEVTKPKAPVIAARPGLVRVHAKSSSKNTKLAPMLAELRVRTPGREDVVLLDGPRSLARLEESVLDTTFHFELTADQIGRGATLSVEIRDPSGVDPTRVRFPATGEDPVLPLNVGALIPKLKVKFAPVRYGADGSDRIPPLSEAVVEAYRKALYKMYPVSEVELTVREPFNWPLQVEASGAGWDALLAAVMKTRKDDRADDDLYYVGVFTPTETEREYCKAGCVLGVAPSSFLDPNLGLRSAMIVGFPSERSHGTLAQELAHSMGRLHAPCGSPASLDLKFPYSDGDTGVWGYDILDKELLDPTEHSDFMSYCNPVWVSDYTWSGIYQRMVEVEATKGVPHAEMKTYHVGPNGTLQPGVSISAPLAAAAPGASTESSESSASQTFVLEDDTHHVITSVRGSFQATSAIGGGIFVTSAEIPLATLRRARFVTK